MIVVKSPNTVTSRKVKEAITICSEYDIYNAQQQPKPQLAKIEKFYLIDKSEVSKYLSRWKNFQMYQIETDIGIFITGRNGYPKQNNCNWNSGPKKGGKDIDWKQKEGEIVSVITGPSKANGWNWIYFVHDFERNISADKNIKEIPSTQLISKHLIKRYMSNFFGYGNLKSDTSLSGQRKERKNRKRGDRKNKDMEDVWENTVEDLAKFHKKINNPLAKMGSYFPLTWQST